MVACDRFAVERIDDQRGNRHYPRVDCADEPRRPAALGTARDDKAIDLPLASRLARQKLLDCVHGADAAFDHRQSHQPEIVLRRKMFDAGVGDEVIFRACLLG